MKKYKLTMPTMDEANAIGVRWHGQADRTALWLNGMTFGLKFAYNTPVMKTVLMTPKTIILETDNAGLVQAITEFVKAYGITVSPA